MKKIIIDPGELQEWLKTKWTLYASQQVRGDLLRLWHNGLGEFRVVHGDDVLYQGNQMTHAIAAWESV